MDEQIGRYRILKRLGGGGFGEVFLAEDPSIGRQVAIKIFRPRDENLVTLATSSGEEGLRLLRARFLGEAKILASLEEAVHVVNVLDYGDLPDGAPYYVMPYLSHSLADELGKDVFDVVALEQLDPAERPRALPLDRCLPIMEQLLRGLSAAHARQLIHRDIKPGNLMLTQDGDLRLVDFGIAKAPEEQHSTISNVGLGSRNYMAPEQRESAKHVDARADIYAVGRVFYRMLTGRLPVGRFADPNVAVPELGKPMNDLILAALSEDRDGRPADAADMLARFLSARPTVGERSTGDAASDSGTWAGEAQAGIRDDLKPLKERILDRLEQYGDIVGTERDGLLAMAAIADLEAADVDALIAELLRGDKTLSGKNKLARLVIDRVQRHGGPLEPAMLDAYDSAAQALGWDRERLEAVAQRAVDDLPPAMRRAPEPAPVTPPRKPVSFHLPSGRAIAAVLAALVIGGGIWGGLRWQQAGADSAAQAEQTMQAAQAAQAAAEEQQKQKSAEQVRIRHVQDYLNRLGYRVAENGEADARTTEAIRAFEQSMKMVATGVPDDMVASALVAEYERRDAQAWEKAEKTDTEAAFRQYQEAFPLGAHVREVEDAIVAAGERQADRERKARDARIAAENRRKEEARVAEENRIAEENRKAELAQQAREREQQERVAQAARDREQCYTQCSRRSRQCVSDNNPRDCELQRCTPSYGGDPIMGLGSHLQCEQNAKREYSACQRETREEQAQCSVREQDCRQDCGYKYN